MLIKYDEERYFSQSVSEIFFFLRKILLNVLHSMSLTVLLPWVLDLPNIKGFLATLIFANGASYA